MSTKPGAGIWRTGGAFGSPIHTLVCAHIADKQSHPANGTRPDTPGKPPLWQSRSETGEASWGTTVGPPLHTTHWGLLKQPDNQKIANHLLRLVVAVRATYNLVRRGTTADVTYPLGNHAAQPDAEDYAQHEKREGQTALLHSEGWLHPMFLRQGVCADRYDYDSLGGERTFFHQEPSYWLFVDSELVTRRKSAVW
jgi:hypothetical protein